MGIGRCKGICDSHRIPKTKYHTHHYCRSCEWWIKQDDCHGSRCPCCGIISTKSIPYKKKSRIGFAPQTTPV